MRPTVEGLTVLGWLDSQFAMPGALRQFVVVRFVTSELSFGGDNSKNVLVLC